MGLTLELPVRRSGHELSRLYEIRFGALPDWLDQLPGGEANALLRLALRRGHPLACADCGL